ncbi:hypothetical protein CAPTEDRAFT_194432 [Capitella teleta]|uniref:G-protein coupled receptors family 1 profile domain-containing protein n=1 Tax=Capitella teleta TaxID=283909 RepID=R7UAM2_CAPTE|nr:hypothetical protein CAPTEDRAFT_194432 [Capitella teleta]|eukprot:ELU00858.1 hypothetical protein CAPTEDRAFT_194432 [Capitella teleta]
MSIAVYLYHRFSSKELICLLNSLGFLDDYKEVQRLLSAIVSNYQPPYQLDGFYQFVFDNADFKVATISGHNTFHSMGGIGCVTPYSGRSRHTIKRSTKLVKSDVTGEFVSLPLFGLNNWQPDQVCSAITVLPKVYFINVFLLSSFIIVILVGVLNLVICAVAINKRKIHPSGTETQQLQMKSQYKLTKMLLVVVGVFYTCWMPYIILNMIALLGTKTVLGGAIPRWFIMLLESSKLLVVINGSLNPIIYSWKLREFRKAFWKTVGLPTHSLQD